MPQTAISVVTSNTGKPVPVINGVTIHSRYDPEKEGVKLATPLLEEVTSTTLVVFGFGFGYHIRPLLDSYENILVYEPCPELLQIVREQPECREVLKRVAIFDDFSKVSPPENPAQMALVPLKRIFSQQYAAFTDWLKHGRQNATSLVNPADLRIMICSPVYGGSYTTAEYVRNACEKLGCQVCYVDNAIGNDILQETLQLSDKNHAGIIVGKLTEILSDLFWERFTKEKPHLCIFVAQAPITIHLLKTIRERTSATTAFWFVEDFRRFTYWQEYAAYFDCFFGIQRDGFFRELEAIGLRNFSYLPMAADESQHRELRLAKEERDHFGADVAFMGAAYPNRLRLFAELTNYNLKLWGIGWEQNPLLQKHVQNNGQRVSIIETVKIYSSTKININLHSAMGDSILEEDGDFVNPRTFEIMACGGFQLVDKRKYLPELFVEGEEIVTFSGLEDLKEKIDYYLTHEDERMRIANNGRRKVLNNHTYTHRIEEMLRALQGKTGKLTAMLQHEREAFGNKLSQINDPELKKFLDMVPARERNSLPALLSYLKETGEMKRYETILRVLETFANDDS
ncbi:MAG: glycosyltransferase [Candidatus Cloacimonetes bacterium]|nr:glycosyltransferase [Candidatus Cloacimonadota bacterium]